ncbi:MAG: pilus assembly protein PilM [Candidatus Omnitrophica bacterium]|nr:pilus assembly protein PilM [Candidatus Omnitrophota bacterium]
MPSGSLTTVLDPALSFLKRLTTVSPQEVKLTVGLDVGATAIKAVALGPRKSAGARPLLGHHLVPLQEGQDVDASEAIKAAVFGLHLPVRNVNLSVSGQWVIMRIVELPTMKPVEMMQALPFEAQRYLPFNIQDVVLDGAVLGPASSNKSWVLIVACKKELLERRMDWVRRAGFEVAVVDVDALAIANGFLAGGSTQRPQGTRAILNVGGQLTNLVIFQGSVPYLVRDIPWGGEKLARNTAEQTGTDPAGVAKQLAEGAVSAEVASAMKLVTEALVTELQLSFDYFENRFGQPPEEILVSGGMSQSAAFLDALKQHLTQTMTPWVPAAGLSPQFAVAYGLALRTS